MSEIVYLSLGSNLGNREEFLRQTTSHLAEMDGLTLLSESSLYQSPALGLVNGSLDFLNKSLKIECCLEPLELLNRTEKLECDIGRTDKGLCTDRVIDVDILLFGKSILHTDRLEIPHPRMSERAFVLLPLTELAPGLIDPRTDTPFSDLLKKIGQQGVAIYKEKTRV